MSWYQLNLGCIEASPSSSSFASYSLETLIKALSFHRAPSEKSSPSTSAAATCASSVGSACTWWSGWARRGSSSIAAASSATTATPHCDCPPTPLMWRMVRLNIRYKCTLRSFPLVSHLSRRSDASTPEQTSESECQLETSVSTCGVWEYPTLVPSSGRIKKNKTAVERQHTESELKATHANQHARLPKQRAEKLRSQHTHTEGAWRHSLTLVTNPNPIFDAVSVFKIAYIKPWKTLPHIALHYITLTLELSAASWSHICPLWEGSAELQDRQQIVQRDRVAVFQTRPWE